MSPLQLTTESITLGSADAFARLGARPDTVFLDTAITTPTIGRYSILATDPLLTLRTPETGVRELHNWRAREVEYGKDLMKEWPFFGGWFGYFAYEYYGTFLPQVKARPAKYPSLSLAFYDTFLVFDHVKGEAYVASLGLAELDGDSDPVLAERRIQALLESLECVPGISSEPGSSNSLQPMTSRQQYLSRVERIQQYIRAGDCYQVNLTQRFDGETALAAPELYGRLRSLSPAPMAAYMDCGAFQILSASPESFLAIRDGKVQTRPIKGTRPRGATEEEDAALKLSLLHSEKDRAELLMITDLERNDLGRVCLSGTIETKRLVETHSLEQVHHLYSLIQGQLPEGSSPWDVLTACFPGGSVTGAPKIRAMQIIRELEEHSREVYTGALGFVSVDGQSHWNIPIRTLIYDQGHVTCYAGGGIVADSDPAAEYEECLVKLEGMRRAVCG